MKLELLLILAIIILTSGCGDKKNTEKTDADIVTTDEDQSGDTGNTGNTADTGNTGNTTDTGDTGNTGNSGNSGNSGDSSDTGEDSDTAKIDEDIQGTDADTETADDDLSDDLSDEISDTEAEVLTESDETPDTSDVDDISDYTPASDDDTVSDPCSTEPCSGILNSDGSCTVDGTEFICGCNGGYHFNKALSQCLQTLSIGWCNTQYPVDLTNADSVNYGNSVSFYTQFYIEGITIGTIITNATHTSIPNYPQIIAQFGTGSPDTNASGWTNWSVPALPNEDKGNNDEYALLDLPINLTPGDYDFIIRVSGDSGNSWKYCNANRLAGSGYNGTDSVNLYDPAKNGHLTVVNPVK